MTRVIAMGECMVELSPCSTADGRPGFARSFAGDVYNTAVYLNRLGAGEVAFLTALGVDALSDHMVGEYTAEGLDTGLVYRHETALPGVYMIETDHEGERSFLYWRSESAARRMIEALAADPRGPQHLREADVIFFSGITLAILDSRSREALWQMLERARAAGVRIIFDPNYRPRLWESAETARREIARGFAAAHVALPGMDDERTLFAHMTPERTAEALTGHGVEEAIIKDGGDNLFSLHEGQLTEFPIARADCVVDTTGAGDAFNAGYLAARFSGRPPGDAVRAGAALAAFVIGHRGAIVPRNRFADFQTRRTKP